MKSKWSIGKFFVLLLVFGTIISACDFDEKSLDLRYSIQVNNQAAGAKAIAAGDKVELYIQNLEYLEDVENHALILVANGDRDGGGSDVPVINNAGWYSVKADLAVINTSGVHPGPYSAMQVRIGKLRVNGTEYSFGNNNHAILGNPAPVWGGFSYGARKENFSGINIADSTVSLKTILTIEPGILDDENNLVPDPFKFIKVEGRINE